MKRFTIIFLILFIGFWTTTLNADIYTYIYVWTDENGVHHFTNYEPPKQARIMIKMAEIAADDDTVHERMEAEILERQQLELQEVAEKQLMEAERLERQQLELQEVAEKQLEEADRKAEEAIKRSEEIFDDAPGSNGGYDDFRDGGDDDVELTGTTYRYYPSYSYRGHFKHRGGHHFRKRHFGKRHFRHFNKHHIGKFHHGKGRHGFKRSNRNFTGHFRGNHHSRGHFRGGHRSMGHFRGGHRGGRR
jgi:hypothetical protein